MLKKFGKEISVDINQNDVLVAITGIFHGSRTNKSVYARFSLYINKIYF